MVWGNRLLAEHENYLSAMAHAIDVEDIGLALELLDSVPPAQIGFALHLPAEPVLALPHVEGHQAYPVALWASGFEAVWRGDLALAEQRAHQALDGASRRDPTEGSVVPFESRVCALRGYIGNARGAFAECAGAFLEAAAIVESKELIGLAALWRGAAASALGLAGERDTAALIAGDGLALARANGMPSAIVFNLYGLAQALADRDPERARRLLDEALALNASLGYEMQNELVGMTLVAARLGDRRLTARLARRSVRHLHWSNDRPILAGMLNIVSGAIDDRDPEAAAIVQGAARAVAVAGADHKSDASARDGGGGAGLIREARRETTRRLRDALGEDRLQQLREEGARMDLDEAVAYALERLDEVLGADD